MIKRTKVASALYKSIGSGKINFNTAAKIFSKIDPYFARNRSRSGKMTRKSLTAHLNNATSAKTKSAWTSILFPSEILHQFDIYPITLEVVAGLLATLELVDPFLERAEESGVPMTMCSFHRVLYGVAKESFVGHPDLVAATSVMCDGNVKSFPEAAHFQNVPSLFLDIPYENSESAVGYVKEQLLDIIKVLENITGMKYDRGKLCEISGKINRVFRLAREFDDMNAKSRQNLFQGHEMANFAFPMHFMLGTDKLIDMLVMRLEDLERGKEYNTFYKNRERSLGAKKLMWLHIVPQYDNDFWPIIDNGITSKIVCDEYSSPYFEDYDISDPLGSIARRLITHPSNGPIERRVEHILKTAKKYNVDGIVHYSSWGCHQAAGNLQLLGAHLQDAGFKFLNLNSDPIDQTNSNSEQLKTRIEAFLEFI